MTAKRCLVAFALVLLAGCKITPGGAGGDGGAGGSAAGGDGGTGGSDCTAETDCEVCRSCAADGPCAEVFDVCFNNPYCVAIDECLVQCGALPDECWETCRAQNAVGIDDYDAARTCLDCDQCQGPCASDFVCG